MDDLGENWGVEFSDRCLAEIGDLLGPITDPEDPSERAISAVDWRLSRDPFLGADQLPGPASTPGATRWAIHWGPHFGFQRVYLTYEVDPDRHVCIVRRASF